MKTIQVLLRHRMATIKARAALRQMCVWVNPADSDYTASYDPLVAKWNAFEKDMADVRSQREGPLRWNPPSYKNEDFLLLQKNRSAKSSTSGPRKQNSRTSYHRPTYHNPARQDVLDVHTKPNFLKRTPEYETSIEDKRQNIEDEEQIPQRGPPSGDMPRRRAQVKETSFGGNPTETEAHERGEIFTESGLQENIPREMPLEDVAVKEARQKLVRQSVLETQMKQMPQKKSPGNMTSVKTRGQDYEEEDRMPLKTSTNMLRKRSHSRESLLRANQAERNSSEKAEAATALAAKEIPSKEVPLKDFSVTEESFEEAESRTPIREPPVKQMSPREISEHVDSFKEIADSEAFAPRPEKSQENQAKRNLRDTSTYVSSLQEELDERDLAHERAEKIAPLKAPKQRTISRERLDTKRTPLKNVPPLVRKSAINEVPEVKGPEDRRFHRNESNSENVYSSIEGISSQQLNDALASASDEGMSKESTTFSKKKYEALRKYIAEAEVEVRVQKQMLITQKEDFKRRLRKMALNPLAEIERNSKVHLQHPLDYFHQKNKILRTGKKIQKKVSDEGIINSTSLPKSNESIPTQEQVQESSEPVIDNDNSINMAAVEDLVIADPNLQSNSADVSPEVHQGKGSKSEGRIRNKSGIQGRSKEILDTLGNVESAGLPHSIQAHNKISKKAKNQLSVKKSNIQREDSDNTEVGEKPQERMINLNITSDKIRSAKRTNQTYIQNPLENLESSDLLETSTSAQVVPERASRPKLKRSHPSSKEKYDYFQGDQSDISSNQLNSQNPVKSQSRTKLLKRTRGINSQPAVEPIRAGHEDPLSQNNQNDSSLESREIPHQEIFGDVADGELKQQKGTGVTTANSVGRASSLLDRSRAKLQKHFMDRSAPIRLNKNAAYIYHPSESTISTMTKTALDAVGNSDIPPIPVLSSYTDHNENKTLDENIVEDLSQQNYDPFLTSSPELLYLNEQPLTAKAQNLPESNLTADQIKDSPSEGWNDTITPMKINPMPANEFTTLQTDNSVRQTQQKINGIQESKLSSILATSERVKNKHQEDYTNKIDYTDSYSSSSRNKPIPEYNYFNASGVEARPNDKDVKSNAKQYSEMQKTKFFSVNESSATGQTTAPEKYDSLPRRSELSNEVLKAFGSKNRSSLLEKLSKTDKSKFKQQMISGGVSISPESYLSNLTNNYQPDSAYSGRLNSEFYKSKDSKNSSETRKQEIQTYNQKVSSTADDQPDLTQQKQISVQSWSQKTLNNPEIDFNSIEKSYPEKQSSRSLERVYPSHQTNYDSLSSNEVLDTYARTKRPNLSETDFNNSFQKSVNQSFASELNNRSSEAIDSLQDIEEGIPSSRVKLRPPLDAFTSFGVGKESSESDSNSYPRHQSRLTGPESIARASKSQTVRSRSMPSKQFFKVNTPYKGNSAKDASVSTSKSRSRSHSSSRTGGTELSPPKTSRRIRDRYPALFKHEQNSDPFGEIFPFTYEENDNSPSSYYKNVTSNISLSKSPPVNFHSNSKDSKLKKSSQDNLKTDPTMIKKSIAPIASEKTRHSQEQFEKNSVQQAKTKTPTEWSDRITQSKDFIESTYGNSVAYRKSYRFDPPIYNQSGMIPSVQDPLDQSTKRYRPTSNLTSNTSFRSSSKTADLDSTGATITFRPGEIETSNKRKPILFKKPDSTRNKFRTRFISPSSYDVENVDSFFRVDESIQLPGSPIRKWKVVPKERGRAVYVASIPPNRTPP